MLTISQVLDRAADLIDVWGHCKGVYWNDAGAYCAEGALWKINIHNGIIAIKLLALHVGSDIVDWNDAATTTKEDVTSTMRALAAIERARETQSQSQSFNAEVMA